MEKHGEAYRVFGKVEEFCKMINKKGFDTCEQSDGYSIQISVPYHSSYVLGKIFEGDILVVYNNNDKDENTKRKSSELENLAKEFEHKVK